MRPDEIYDGDPEAVPPPAPAATDEPAWRLPALFGLFTVLVAALILSFYMSPLQGDQGQEGPPGGTAALKSPTPVQDAGSMKVYVVGEVRKPGVVALGPDARVEDALRAAGGMTEKADTLSINLAKRVKDEEQIVVRSKDSSGPLALDPLTDLPPPEDLASPGGPAPDEAMAVEESATESTVTDEGTTETSTTLVEEDVMVAGGPTGARKTSINQATAEELDSNVKGLGPALARAVVEYRQGPPPRAFETVEDLLKVPGIGPAKLEQIRPQIDL